MAEVTFDYQNLIEVEGGLQSGELNELEPRLREAADGLLGDPPGFMRLPKTGEYAEASARAAEEIRTSRATDFIHVGIGGSALGPMALHKALSHPYYNALPGEERSGPRLHFAENTDSATLSAILDVADPEGTWVNVVTKSGSTAETMANFLVIRGFLVDSLGDFGFQERMIATTDPEADSRSGRLQIAPHTTRRGRPVLGSHTGRAVARRRNRARRRRATRRCFAVC
jgi:glucose-6-phosphate isomerase